jgi:hypothetical protein
MLRTQIFLIRDDDNDDDDNDDDGGDNYITGSCILKY